MFIILGTVHLYNENRKIKLLRKSVTLTYWEYKLHAFWIFPATIVIGHWETNDQCIETGQLICHVNHLTGFYMWGILDNIGLILPWLYFWISAVKNWSHVMMYSSSVKWSHLRQIPNFKKINLGHLFKSQGKIFLSFLYTLFFLIFKTWKNILRHEKVSLVALFNITIIFHVLFSTFFS